MGTDGAHVAINVRSIVMKPLIEAGKVYIAFTTTYKVSKGTGKISHCGMRTGGGRSD